MAKKPQALGFVICLLCIVFLFVGCAKQKIDPTGIYLAHGGLAYIEIVRDASDNLMIKGASLFFF